MRLTTFSDLSIRVLLLAASRPEVLTTIDQTASVLRVSRAHLMKVVNTLVRAGFLEGRRGRSGGYALARDAQDINLADVIQETEPDFAMVECMRNDNDCVLTKLCKYPSIMESAVASFLGVLQQHTLADISLNAKDLKKIGVLIEDEN